MNSVNIIGRLTRDPELRYSQQGKAVTNLSIAVQKYGNKDEADFFDCVAFEKTAETIANNLVKGREIGISGRLQQERWTDQQGQNRTAVKIMINSITFIGPKQQDNQQSTQPPAGPPQYQQGPPQGYQQQPGFIPPAPGGMPPQGPGGYPQQGGGYQQQPNGYPQQNGGYQQQGQPNSWQPPAGPPTNQPPQGQIGFQRQQAGGYSGNLDDIPF